MAMTKLKHKNYPKELYLTFENMGTEDQYPVTGISEKDVFNGLNATTLQQTVQIAHYKLVEVKAVEARLVYHDSKKT